jgi:hypothetical protein
MAVADRAGEERRGAPPEAKSDVEIQKKLIITSYCSR